MTNLATNEQLTMKGKLDISQPDTFIEFDSFDNLSLTIDQEKVEKNFMGQKGFKTTFMTAKSISMEITGKITDSDFSKILTAKAFAEVKEQNNIEFEMGFAKRNPSATTPAKIEFSAAIEFGEMLGGESNETADYNLTINVNGQPTFTDEVVPSEGE